MAKKSKRPESITIHHTGVDTSDKSVITCDSSRSYITTTTGDYSISNSGLTYTYEPAVISTSDGWLRYSGSSGNEFTIKEKEPVDIIADKLERIVEKLEQLDKKYLENVMKSELEDIVSEINKYREGNKNESNGDGAKV